MSKKKIVVPKREWINVVQNTDEWFDLRRKLITASATTKFTKTAGKLGQTEDKYCRRLAIERYGYKTPSDELDGIRSIEQGKVREPSAIEDYELSTFKMVSPGGFFRYGNLGHSPDGRSPKQKLFQEVKSPDYDNHFKAIIEGIDNQYFDQIQFGLHVSGYDGCDYISYNPDYIDHKIHVKTIYPDKERIEFLLEKCKLIEERVAIYLADIKLKAFKYDGTHESSYTEERIEDDII